MKKIVLRGFEEMITENNWPDDWDDVVNGTEVSEEVYNYMLNVLPPISIHGGYAGFQMSEPQDHREDERGRWRARYLTFINIGKRYFFAGVNFCGECPVLVCE